MAFRSLLFLPADRVDRLERAIGSGADAVCLDLEDAVAPAQKPEAHAAAVQALVARDADRGGPAVGVRINAAGTPWFEDDLSVLGPKADFVMVPKATSALAIATVAKVAPRARLWPLIESAGGLMRCWEIAAAPGVQGVLFGAFDYSADVGCVMEWEPLLFARSQLAAACARARVELLDAPSGDIRDNDSLAGSTRRAKGLGFTGRSCIHPDQVAVVNSIFTPTAAEVDRARRLVDAFDAAGGRAAQLDGRLIELPVALAARRVLARAGV